jgi:hypothetical protein
MSSAVPTRERLLKIFEEYNLDKDKGNATLDKQEAMSAFMTLFPNDSPTRILKKIQQIDLNKDGELSKVEFLQIGSKFFFTYRDRIRAMLVKYAGYEVTEAMIDGMIANHGGEEELLDVLKDQYGEEPDKTEFDETGTRLLAAAGQPTQGSQVNSSRSTPVHYNNNNAAPASARRRSDASEINNNNDEDGSRMVSRRNSAQQQQDSRQISRSASSTERSIATPRPETPPILEVPQSHHHHHRRSRRNFFGFKK